MKLESTYGLFDHFPDGVCLADAKGDVLYMNPAASSILGVRNDHRQVTNACGLLCGNLQLASGKDAKCDCALRQSNATASVTFQGRLGSRPNFNWRDERIQRNQSWWDLRVRCVRVWMPIDKRAGEDEELHLIIIEDATTAAALRRHREDWRTMVAHDLRQPLTAVFSALKLLEAIHPLVRPGAGGRESAVVATGLRSCRKMIELLDLYLDVARIDAGARPTKNEPTSVENVLNDVVDEAMGRASGAGVSMELDAHKEIFAAADAELFRRVISNLVDNAIKYNVKGGSVIVKAWQEEQAVCVSVKDTGRGIESGVLPHIFDRYYQAEARRAGRIQGTGLGLTFVQEAVKAMGGSVSVESEAGKGSTFVVTLKAAPPSVETEAKP